MSDVWADLLTQYGVTVSDSDRVALQHFAPAVPNPVPVAERDTARQRDHAVDPEYVTDYKYETEGMTRYVYKGYNRLTHFKEHLRRVMGCTRFNVVLPEELVRAIAQLKDAKPCAESIREKIKEQNMSRLLYRDIFALASRAKLAKPLKLDHKQERYLIARFRHLERCFDHHRTQLERRNFPSYHVTLHYLFAELGVKPEMPLPLPSDLVHRKYLLDLLYWLDKQCTHALMCPFLGTFATASRISSDSYAHATAATAQLTPQSTSTNLPRHPDPMSNTGTGTSKHWNDQEHLPPPTLPRWRDTMQRKRFSRRQARATKV